MHVKETLVMKILMQLGTNVSYMAKISDCLIEICNTHTYFWLYFYFYFGYTHTFGYQTQFFAQFTFKSHLA